MAKVCYAPVFEGSSAIACFFKNILYLFILIMLIIIFVISFGNQTILCSIKQTIFRIQHCREGNSDGGINLNDAYARHVRAYRDQYGKNEEWEQWMLANRDRYENGFAASRSKPSTLNIAFRYDTTPIAYDPPWSDEQEHMNALETLMEAAYPSYDFEFIFNGDTSSSYANVIAGIPTNSSHTSGNSMYLYFETIINHEFAHVMRIPHHYDTNDQIGDGNHMPPGESTCIMDRNSNQFCSACRTALHIPLDVDNDAAISAASSEIRNRIPY